MLFLADAAGLVGALALFAHLTADTIVNGSATSHLAPTDHADRECRGCWGGFFLIGHFFREATPKPSLLGADLTKDSTFPMLPFQKFSALQCPSLGHIAHL